MHSGPSMIVENTELMPRCKEAAESVAINQRSEQEAGSVLWHITKQPMYQPIRVNLNRDQPGRSGFVIS
jgi:hypothetical protein